MLFSSSHVFGFTEGGDLLVADSKAENPTWLLLGVIEPAAAAEAIAVALTAVAGLPSPVLEVNALQAFAIAQLFRGPELQERATQHLRNIVGELDGRPNAHNLLAMLKANTPKENGPIVHKLKGDADGL